MYGSLIWAILLCLVGLTNALSLGEGSPTARMMVVPEGLRIRTVTCFVSLTPHSFAVSAEDGLQWKDPKVEEAIVLLRSVEGALVKAGYTVQTVRLVTNAFGLWLPPAAEASTVLQGLDRWLGAKGIDFCSLGPATSVNEVATVCPLILRTSPRFSCSAALAATDVSMASACARCVLQIAHTEEPAFLQDGLGNFHFAVAASCAPLIPFFPVAKAPDEGNGLTFAIGLENGGLAHELLSQCGSLQNIGTVFHQGMSQALAPIQRICTNFETDSIAFAGIDTSLNPSLEATGSVARALESLSEVSSFCGPGTLAVAAAVTKSLQSLDGIRRTGYCGIMLPVCEDARLAELTESNQLRLVDLLSISSVCGVGIDTVPLAGDSSEEALAALMLDVAGLADRWKKPLSCRVFPLPGKTFGDRTTFDFPHMINAALLPL